MWGRRWWGAIGEMGWGAVFVSPWTIPLAPIVIRKTGRYGHDQAHFLPLSEVGIEGIRDLQG